LSANKFAECAPKRLDQDQEGRVFSHSTLMLRRQLCDQHVTIENQAAHVEDAILRRLNKRRLARLKADIHPPDKRPAEIVAADAILAQRYELLTSMRGVGPTLAFTLIALLPELGQMSRKQIGTAKWPDRLPVRVKSRYWRMSTSCPLCKQTSPKRAHVVQSILHDLPP